jgi:condensin-2 complex subunit G2
MLESFRDIYIRAWKESPEETRKCIQEEALQDLMYSSLYFEKSSSVRAVRAILTSFHQAKNLPEIDQLLYKLYSPILWRALKASNPSVRVNASVILAETFPLCDQSGSNYQFQECLDRTVNALLSLLRDSYPRVRVAGSDAAVRILHDYWTVLPSESIRLVLNRKCFIIYV